MMKRNRALTVALILIGVVTTPLPTQAQDGATLVVRVPKALMEVPYWVYVNQRLISSGAPNSDFVHIWNDDGSRVTLMDANGVVARGTGTGEIYWLREGLDDSRVFGYASASVPSGRHSVELVVAVRAVRADCDSFPLSVSATEVSVAAGENRVQTMVSVSNMRLQAMCVRAVRFVETDDPVEWIRSEIRRVETTIEEYDSDPVALALERARRDLRNVPPAGRVVEVDLPQAYGGPRELDAVQIRMIVSWLKKKHWDWFTRPSFWVNSPDAPELWNKLWEKTRSSIDSVDRLNEIADVLERATAGR